MSNAAAPAAAPETVESAVGKYKSTYLSISLLPRSAQELFNWLRSYRIPAPTLPTYYHITLYHSVVPDLLSEQELNTHINLAINPAGVEFNLYGSRLGLTFKSKYINDRRAFLRAREIKIAAQMRIALPPPARYVPHIEISGYASGVSPIKLQDMTDNFDLGIIMHQEYSLKRMEGVNPAQEEQEIKQRNMQLREAIDREAERIKLSKMTREERLHYLRNRR